MQQNRNRGWSGAAVAVLLLFLGGCASSPQFIPALDDEPIRPGDLLLVHSSVSWSGGQFGVRWRVDSAGNLKLPYAPVWRVAGKRPSEVAAELSRHFSVGRSVTFSVEHFGGAFSDPIPRPAPVPQPGA